MTRLYTLTEAYRIHSLLICDQVLVIGGSTLLPVIVAASIRSAEGFRRVLGLGVHDGKQDGNNRSGLMVSGFGSGAQ